MDRIHALLRILKKHKADSFFINSEANITYLTGFSGDSSRLLISQNSIVLITDGRYTEQAEKECGKEIKIVKWVTDKRYSRETYEPIFKEYGAHRLGFEGDKLSYSEFLELQAAAGRDSCISLSGITEELRLVKNEKEISFLKTACEISDKSLWDTLGSIKVGATEAEIAAVLEFNLRKNGSEGISFETLLLSGQRTSLLHGKPGQNRIQAGDFLLFDFGALYKGYHADMSRTFVMGKPDEKKKIIYDIIFKAQQNALDCIKDGVEGKRADDAVREMIPPEYLEYYYPGLGHGVGLEIHENPFIKNSSQFTFREGMTVTIEPGVYIPGWGGLRIEDTLVVRKEGIDVLTKFPKELMVIE